MAEAVFRYFFVEWETENDGLDGAPWGAEEEVRRKRGGNVAMLFGLMLIPVLAVTGGAVDYGRAVAAKSRLQGIVDAAANAGARLPATANQNREKAVLAFSMPTSPAPNSRT